MFTPNEIEEIMNIIRLQHIVFIGNTIGSDMLSDSELKILLDNGITLEEIQVTPFEEMFRWGLLSQAIGHENAKELDYPNFKKFVSGKKYLPLTPVEKKAIEVAKKQAANDIRGLGNRIIQQTNQLIIEGDQAQRQAYEKIITEETVKNIEKRRTVTNLVSEIGHATGDWTRDFGRISDYVTTLAFEEGRATQLIESDGGDVQVYKTVFNGACKKCVELFTTAGVGSKPKIFKLSELMANGNNIGKKSADWLPTVGPVHPFCFINAKTPIYTSEGWKHISKLNVGDLVLTHKGRFRKVTKLIFTKRSKKDVVGYVNIKVNIGDREIEIKRVTFDHPFLVNNEWIKVKDIKVGDKMKLLTDKCEGDSCTNNIPIYSVASKGGTGDYVAKYCSKSCFSKHNAIKQWENMRDVMVEKITIANRKEMSSRTYEENFKNTQKARDRCKELHPDYSFLHTEEVVQKQRTTNAKKSTFIEKKLRFFLDQLGVEYVTDKVIKRNSLKKNNQHKFYFPDIYIPSLNMVIEADGEAWHNDEEYDNNRDIEIKELIGADTFRFKGNDILNNGDQVFESLKRIIHNHLGIYGFKDVEVTSIEIIKYSDTNDQNSLKDKVNLYNFSVEEDESYIVNGIVSHNCRCLLTKVPMLFDWNEETQSFDKPKPIENKVERKSKVKITIGDKVIEV